MNCFYDTTKKEKRVIDDNKLLQSIGDNVSSMIFDYKSQAEEYDEHKFNNETIETMERRVLDLGLDMVGVIYSISNNIHGPYGILYIECNFCKICGEIEYDDMCGCDMDDYSQQYLKRYISSLCNEDEERYLEYLNAMDADFELTLRVNKFLRYVKAYKRRDRANSRNYKKVALYIKNKRPEVINHFRSFHMTLYLLEHMKVKSKILNPNQPRIEFREFKAYGNRILRYMICNLCGEYYKQSHRCLCHNGRRNFAPKYSKINNAKPLFDNLPYLPNIGYDLEDKIYQYVSEIQYRNRFKKLHCDLTFIINNGPVDEDYLSVGRTVVEIYHPRRINKLDSDGLESERTVTTIHLCSDCLCYFQFCECNPNFSKI